MKPDDPKRKIYKSKTHMTADQSGSAWICFHGGAQREPNVISDRRLPCPACGHSLPCNHVWVIYEADEDASASLSAPEGAVTFSERVCICAVCARVQPAPAWVAE